MAISSRNTSASDRLRNVFIAGIVLGLIAAWILSALFGGKDDSAAELQKVNQRLDAIEQKLATPSAAPVSSSSQANDVSISAINKNPRNFIGQSVDLTGKVTSANEGVGFVLTAPDGTFLWVHTKSKLPTGSASVKGKVTELKDQLATWKNESGWPADDSALTAKLRDEKVFIEADSVS